jgi:TonB family protein
MARALAAAWAAAALLAGTQARADDAGPVLEPPVLAGSVEASYPAGALSEGIEAEVVLEISIDDRGAVTDVVVVGPAGHGFDEAAVDAARQFAFEPATSDGEPVASTITYRYRFFLEQPPPAGEIAQDEPVQDEPAVEGEYVTVVKGQKEEGVETVERKLSTGEILMMPGTGGDLLKSVMQLPGLARAPSTVGMLVIRGSAPEDSLILLDGHPIPLAYHLGGLSSVINSEFIDEISFVPGNFSVRHGRGTGGLVDVRPRWEIPDRWSIVGDFDTIDASLWTFGPLGDKGFVAASVRRSYMDLILKLGGKALEDRMDLGATAVPVYWDYQVFAMYRPGSSDELRFSVVGDSDAYRLVFDDPGSDPGLSSFFMRNMFHVVQVRWRHALSPTAAYEASVQAGWLGVENRLGTAMDTDADSLVISHRQELSVALGRTAELALGLDLKPYLNRIRMLAPEGGWGADTLAGASLAETDTRSWQWDLAAYAETRLHAGEKVVITPGVRVDYLGVVDSWEPQPRLGVSVTPVDVTTLTAGVGLFAQAPQLLMLDEDLGNPHLRPMRGVHYGVGVEQRMDPAWLDVSLQLFFKQLDHVVDTSEEHVTRDGELVLEHFHDRSRGRAYGLELLVRIQPGHPVYGWLAYTLSRSERWSREAGRWIPFDYDQPHVLTILLGAELPRGFGISLRYRVASGNPYSEVTHAVFDADHDRYIPIYETVPSGRLPTFHQLDLRLDKKWEWSRVWLKLYLDITNVYYAKNKEYPWYNYDYSEKKFVAGLPFYPSVGFQVGFKVPPR